MDNESAPVIESMRVAREEIICGKRVILGELFGKETGIVICGIGKVNAASGTQLAIDRFKPETVINFGVAGGLNDGVKVGNLYEISAAVQYDFDLTQLNGTEIGTLDECKENYLPLSLCNIFPQRKLATGDRFNDSPQDYQLITKRLGADIRDMEGGAIAQTCMHAGVKLVAFKAISDLAGLGSTTEQYLRNLTLCFATMKDRLKYIVEAI